MPNVTPFLWLEKDADEAAKLYVSLFKNSEILSVRRWGPGGPAPAGSVMTVSFRLDGRVYHLLNGGPHYKLSPAFSLFVECDTQDEIDHYWERLLDGGGKIDACGWLRDRFGLSWQIIPRSLPAMLADPDPERARRVTAVMYKMMKLDLAILEKAYRGD